MVSFNNCSFQICLVFLPVLQDVSFHLTLKLDFESFTYVYLTMSSFAN